MKPLVLGTRAVGFQWETVDPFLFCVHHVDDYPRGNGRLGPFASLEGRQPGMDFEGLDGWRMYHGDQVPGFPQHPHRGFETVTVVRKGLVDHSDSLGARARYGHGDVQWLTAGAGVVHSEMFPLTDASKPNPVELFQIWLNLPAADKRAPPHFSMLWANTLPRIVTPGVELTVIAGSSFGAQPPAPPPRSWASRPDSDVAIVTVKLEANAATTLPPAQPGTNRTLYFFSGAGLEVGGQLIGEHVGLVLDPTQAVPLRAVGGACEVLLLQGRPIAEPVAHHGPFVMTTQAELLEAFHDYRATRFGGWPWPDDEPTHGAETRFASHDGQTERP